MRISTRLALCVVVCGWLVGGAGAQVQNCTTSQECQYEGCMSSIAYGCSCDMLVYQYSPFQQVCMDDYSISIARYTCYTSPVQYTYVQCSPRGNKTTIPIPVPTTTPIPLVPGQNCTKKEDCNYAGCNDLTSYDCSCYPTCLRQYGISDNTCYNVMYSNVAKYTQCALNKETTAPTTTTVATTTRTTTVALTSSGMSTTVQASTSTTPVYMPTTTRDPSLPPDPPSNIPGLVRVVPGVGEYCVSSYVGFETSSLRMPEALYLGEPVYSNKRGCNGTWFALLSSVTNRWYGFVCPWEMDKGCSVIQDGGYYIDCASGCYVKAQCANVTANAYFSGAGTSALNCPYNCQDNYQKLENGTCVPLPPAQTLPAPTSGLRRCFQYGDCDHCPRAGFLGSSVYNVWGCAGYDVRLSVFSTTYNWVRDSVLLSAYCVYYTNDTDVRYCAEPMVTTTPAPASSPGVLNLSVGNVSGNGSNQVFNNPRYRCSAYANCSFCPGPYTSGCSGVSVVQRFPDGRYGVILRNFAPSGMMQQYCVYLSAGVWGYCPDYGMPVTDIVVLKKAISFWFNVPEGYVNVDILSKYQWRIAVVLGIAKESIELVPGMSQLSAARRRLLADNLVYANMQVDANLANNITALINSPGFFNLLFNGNFGNSTALAQTTAPQPGTTTLSQVNSGSGGEAARLSDAWVAVIVGVVGLLVIGGVVVGIVVGCGRTQSYVRIPKERVIAVRLRC